MTDIICLPGTMCDARLWQFIQGALADKVRLHHLAIPMATSIEAIVDSLAQTLPHEPINLLGFSMGGYLACAFAVKYPQRVRRLMVVSNTASGLLEDEIQQRQQALNWVAKRGYKGIVQKKAKAMLGARNKNNDILIDIIQQMDRSLGQAVFVQQLSSSLERPELFSALVKSAVPVCFAVGMEDVLISQSSLAVIHRSQTFELHLASHCGHMLPLEQPLWLAQVIRRFYGVV